MMLCYTVIIETMGLIIIRALVLNNVKALIVVVAKSVTMLLVILLNVFPITLSSPSAIFSPLCMPSSCHQVVIQIFVSRINTCPKSSRLTVAAKGLLLSGTGDWQSC